MTPDSPRMRIIYVARHDHGGNDEEGAISHALTELGHQVIEVPEYKGRSARRISGDFVLFHKWDDYEAMRRNGKPLVFWYFDLVDFPDSSIADRCHRRVQWMKRVIPMCTLGFCTDGDWVANDGSGKLHWLPQAADARLAVTRRPFTGSHSGSILFTGVENGGTTRKSFVREMRERYGDRLSHFTTGLHGTRLSVKIRDSLMVVAPDGPVTDNYWSNRVYLTLGFGGFLLHPHCHSLTGHYRNFEHLVFYDSRDQLFELIDKYTDAPEACELISHRGWRHTLEHHTYHHRCAELIEKVSNVL